MLFRLIFFSLVACGSLNAYPAKSSQNQPSPQQHPSDENQEVANRENAFENTLYDRQQNRQEQQERQQQQQYYYQQPQGNGENTTQYNRTKPQRTQYFNPRDE